MNDYANLAWDYAYLSLKKEAPHFYNEYIAHGLMYLVNFIPAVRITTQTDVQCAPMARRGQVPLRAAIKPVRDSPGKAVRHHSG